MRKIFDFLNYNYLYERCMMASIAHAIMVGKYNLLSSEHSWDGKNYIFQNMEGVRGVISFDEGAFVCVTQNETIYDMHNKNNISELFCGVEKKIMDLAVNEALQYMLIDINGVSMPFISTAFWGNGATVFSNQSEDEIVGLSEKIILPFLYCENDAKKYWKNYYEMSDEQSKMMEDIYKRRINLKGKIKLTVDEKEKIKDWFTDIDECFKSLEELNIFLP